MAPLQDFERLNVKHTDIRATHASPWREPLRAKVRQFTQPTVSFLGQGVQCAFRFWTRWQARKNCAAGGCLRSLSIVANMHDSAAWRARVHCPCRPSPASRSRARAAAAAAILPREGLAESGFIRCGEPRGDAKGEIRPAKSGGWLRDRDVPSRAAALPARA